MAIREDIVASAATFLQDPSVASTPIEKKIAFLQAKNLTQEEVTSALARVGHQPAAAQGYGPQAVSSPVAQQPPQAFYNNQPYPYPPYTWQGQQQQQQQQAPPRRDWRDWFIMATVVSGVSYGLYSLGKRYVYPLVAPPTPDRLEQDKKSIDEQFEKAFALVEQLAKDTEELKNAEAARTTKLDTTVSELETVMGDLKSANRRRDDEAQRIRDDVQNLKESIPRAMNNQKELTDNRLREINAELKSLKTLITQRMNPATASTSTSSYMRPGLGGVGTTTASSPAVTPAPAAAASVESTKDEPKEEANSRTSSPFGSGIQAKASIPAWQMMASKKATSSSSTAAGASSSTPAVNGTADAGSGATEATASP
ncbi:peroxisomal membrane anchor protein conserved region-domain-containing protein [Cladorrhinum sp. PSN259]|nr:peroxisomal membrane anchor protein conserved region-domain-containing protein [Cladorrhinum sp. PSN259]